VILKKQSKNKRQEKALIPQNKKRQLFFNPLEAEKKYLIWKTDTFKTSNQKKHMRTIIVPKNGRLQPLNDKVINQKGAN
jgi:hypothetical protein